PAKRARFDAHRPVPAEDVLEGAPRRPGLLLALGADGRVEAAELASLALPDRFGYANDENLGESHRRKVAPHGPPSRPQTCWANFIPCHRFCLRRRAGVHLARDRGSAWPRNSSPSTSSPSACD